MLSLDIEPKKLHLKYTWKISRGSFDQKTNCFVCAKSGEHLGCGEASGITQPEMAEHPLIAEFNNLPKDLTLETLSDFPNMSSRLRFAIESALVHLKANQLDISVPQLLGVAEVDEVNTSYSLPIMEVDEVIPFIDERELHRFSTLKVKVGDRDQVAATNKVLEGFSGSIRIDANEAFKTASGLLKFMDEIDLSRVEFIEQPIHREDIESYLELRKYQTPPIIADESVQSQSIDQKIIDQFDGINVKLMKSGGYYKALEQLKTARENGMKTMLGCMVETSLGIWSALNIGENVDWYDLDGFLFFKEDPYQLVKENNGKIIRNKSADPCL